MVSPYSVMSITMTFLLFIIFGYFFIVQKEKAVGIWSIAWLVSTIRQVIGNLTFIVKAHDIYLVLNEIFIILSAILFVIGTYYFINRKAPWWWRLNLILVSLWSVFRITNNLHFVFRIIPIIVLLLYAYTKIGMIFLRDKGISNKILGISFICGGLMTITFVLLVNIPEIIYIFSPWIFLLNFILAIAMAVSLLDVSFRKQVNKLKVSVNYNPHSRPIVSMR